jgi:2OG-Fe(II) oxygenase superfamily
MTDEARATEKHLSPEHYIFDGVVGADELLWIYHELLSTSAWMLTRSSTGAKASGLPFISFPGLNIETRGDIHIPFLSGYFRSVIFRVRAIAKKNNNLILPPNIQRIHVGAKSSFSKTEFHVDSNEENVWTILGFLNPVWNAPDGGEFFLEHHKVEYKAGRFVVFPSNTLHDGGHVRNEKLNYWRVAVSILLDNGDKLTKDNCE